MRAPLTTSSIPARRWLGLESYTENDHDAFHGRARESKELLRFVKRDVLTVVFGASGTGKTSLLRAGLFPLLRDDHFLPVHIRVDYGPGAASYRAQVKAQLHRACQEGQIEVTELSGPLPGTQDESLWEYLHRTEFWDRRNRVVVPVLGLDQFEEIFTVGAARGAQEQFLAEMADVIENYVPPAIRARLERNEKLPFVYGDARYKIVISLREDWVPRLDSLRKTIPSIMHNRFPLTRMNGEQAREAVMGPGAGVVDRPTAEAIVRFVAASGKDAAQAYGDEAALDKVLVEPSLLSLMCAELDRQRIEQSLPAITTRQLRAAGGNILNDFYERGFEGLPRVAREFVEDRLLTASGFRGTVPREDALRAGLTEAGIAVLVDRRLIRVEERLGIPHLEIIHDVLARVAARSREARLERERLEEQENRRREEEKAKRDLREKRFKRALVVAGVVAIAALGGAWISLHYWEEAERARGRAIEEAEKASVAYLRLIDSLKERDKLGGELEGALDQALKERKTAEAARREALEEKKKSELLAREREVLIETQKREVAGRDSRIRELEARIRRLEEPLTRSSEGSSQSGLPAPPPPPPAPGGDPLTRQTAEQLRLRSRLRPFSPGASFGAGSACCVVKDSAGRRYLLGLAGVFGGYDRKPLPGTEISQPNVAFSKKPDPAARLVRTVGSEFGSGALAELLPGVQFRPSLPGGRTFSGVARVRPGDRVYLLGSGSGYSEGKVISADANEVVITRVSAPGDSGAPVFLDNGMLVGILWGGAQDRSMVLPAAKLLSDLGVQLDTSGAILEDSTVLAASAGCAPIQGSPYQVFQQTPRRLIDPRMLGLVHLDAGQVRKPGEVSQLSILVGESGKGTSRNQIVASAAVRRMIEFRDKGATLDFQFQGVDYRVEVLEIGHAANAQGSVVAGVCEVGPTKR